MKLALSQFWPHHHKLTFGDSTSVLSVWFRVGSAIYQTCNGFRVQSALNPKFEIEHSLDLEYLKPSTDRVPYIQGLLYFSYMLCGILCTLILFLSLSGLLFTWVVCQFNISLLQEHSMYGKGEVDSIVNSTRHVSFFKSYVDVLGIVFRR